MTDLLEPIRSAPTAEQFRALFEPRGILVTGASQHPGKVGFSVLHNILMCGYQGRVFGLGRERGELLGAPVLASLDELSDDDVDLVFVCSPPAMIPDLLRRCAAKGVRAAFVSSAGFSEAGDDASEQALATLADELGILIVGPNGAGVISTPVDLCAQLQGPYPPAGRIGVVSQSGNFVLASMNYASASGVGASRTVSIGNAAVVGVPEFLTFFADDPATSVTLTYVEGIVEGRAFFEQARAAARRKPVVVIKGGVTPDGERAAASHTGAMATDDRVFDGACRQAGVIRARTVEEGFEAAATFATQPLPRGPRVAVVTLAGGWGVMAADAIDATQLEVVPLPDDLLAAIDQMLPPRWSRRNPIDLAGGETRDTVPEVLELCAQHPDVDAVIFIGFGIQSNTASMIRARSTFFPDHGLDRIVAYSERQDGRYGAAAAELSERFQKPILCVTELAVTDPSNRAPASVRESGRLCYPSVNRAVVALHHLWTYARFRADRP